MRGKSIIVVITLLLFLAFSVINVFSNDFLGVDEGNWASYEVETSWQSWIPGDVVPQYYVDINQTAWVMQVIKVLDQKSIRLNVTIHFRNHTTGVEVYEGSVSANSGYLKLWVVRSGLSERQKIYDEQKIVVNSTHSMLFAGAYRSVVYASFRQPESETGNSTHSVFWDKKTGVICDWLAQYRSYSDGNVSIAHVRISIVKTDLWEPQPDFLSSPEFWSVVIAVIIIVVSMGGLFWFLLKHRKSKRHVGRKRVSLDNRHRT